MTRTEVIAEARRWIGTPWQHQAALRGVGTDCIGIIGGVARDLGDAGGAEWNADPALHRYGPTPQPRFLLAGVDRFLDRVPVDEATRGDILLMRFERDPQHFALLSAIAPPAIIHASNLVGRVVEHRLDDKWRSRVVRAYRYRGIV